MKICPRCEQGVILEKVLKFNKQHIFICDECDAIWFDMKNISPTTFIDFSTYMEGFSRTDQWSEFEDKVRK